MKPFRRPKKRAMLEGSIEEACRTTAAAVGYDSRKMNGLGHRSWPDRFFLSPRTPNLKGAAKGRSFWVEFKKPGEESTPDQQRKQEELRERGEIVYSDIDSREKFLEILERERRTNRR